MHSIRTVCTQLQIKSDRVFVSGVQIFRDIKGKRQPGFVASITQQQQLPPDTSEALNIPPSNRELLYLIVHFLRHDKVVGTHE